MPLVKADSILDLAMPALDEAAVAMKYSGASIDLSPRQQLAFDDAVRYAAEIDAREREHFKQLPEQIKAENDQVMTDLAAGRLYLVNVVAGSTNVVHFANCRTIRHQVDRDIAHEFEIERGDAIEGSWHSGSGYDYVAKWPNLVTLAEVEDLRSYRACGLCNPDTKQRRKYAGARNAPSKITSVTQERIGREYETPEGSTSASWRATPSPATASSCTAPSGTSSARRGPWSPCSPRACSHNLLHWPRLPERGPSLEPGGHRGEARRRQSAGVQP
ncbi:hypothetical protein GCM10025867_50030 (plasmid) [Frondihabitans sucicola]|uniref:Uncharacterized protein n=1 Tax=Frondihabitans sucicola TaxID=1268041 RepID=A0ABN6Y5Z3_9MICO|nr:hypothetical protein [Frondihabitans sucicola]BDZ52762.1 hypothetical protein GCM10025867_50030 [Frondihabitans sucicola]